MWYICQKRKALVFYGTRSSSTKTVQKYETKQQKPRNGKSSLTHIGSKTTKGAGPHAASLSGKEDTWDEGGREKRGRRGVHLESAHPLQEGWGPLCHTVTVMPPLHYPKGHRALHCTASNTHTPFVHLQKRRWTHSHLSPYRWQVTAAATQTQISTGMYTPTVWLRGRQCFTSHFNLFCAVFCMGPLLPCI